MLNEYLMRTAALRGNVQKLLITYRPPHKAASRDTIRRWTKDTMSAAGIDMTIFTPHSTRSATTSSAATRVPQATILATAGWSQASTFQKYYQKPITNDSAFADSVLLRS